MSIIEDIKQLTQELQTVNTEATRKEMELINRQKEVIRAATDALYEHAATIELSNLRWNWDMRKIERKAKSGGWYAISGENLDHTGIVWSEARTLVQLAIAQRRDVINELHAKAKEMDEMGF